MPMNVQKSSGVRRALLLLLPAALIVGACGGPTVQTADVEVRDGVTWRTGSEEPFTGTVITPFADTVAGVAEGVVASRTYYREGVPDGVAQGFFPDGSRRFEHPWVAGQREGEWRKWHQNGQLAQVQPFASNSLEGVVRAWTADGQLVMERAVAHGKAEGTTRTWYPGGAPESEASYQNGVLQGTLVRWYENGQQQVERGYRNGFPDGPVREWYDNGQLKIEGAYSMGHTEGPYKRWYENGAPALDGVFHDGQSIEIRMWDENGNPIAVEPDLKAARGDNAGSVRPLP